ncbi:threonine synthase [Brucepastera parasyntrophica]|uniref:threonine synthase n=1 Tax=Brucepastera parasyntrophica TaxID=2880008 RepID=UPI0021096ACB|nr:threonine synthase [Brucepastera parasyntrophica]ULQ61208.1 threonine synthase [Brucepastera parasyntrophica]
MLYSDTRDSSRQVSFRTAVMEGMSHKTGGLYMPVTIPQLSKSLVYRNPVPSFRDIAFETAKLYIEDEIPEGDLMEIIVDAYPFAAPVAPIDRTTYVLELFHGPTCAFKDFGARFMARVMAFFNRDENDPLHILVATSGDTGSAVGSAFHGVPGIDVTILYPTGRISPLQEKQLSTFDENVRALAVSGSFDDCQKLVKTAFTDESLREKLRLSSANSINISRLLPQSFYYIHGALLVHQRSWHDNKIDQPSLIVTVPSGNFGNLTSGLLAKKMGAPIRGFIAATNSNHTIPDWLSSGQYEARPSVATLSNAMDVGAPSNYERIAAMYTVEEARRIMAGYWLDDDGTMEAIRSCYDRTGYIIDPHGAVGWKAWTDTRDGAMSRLLAGFSVPEGMPGLSGGRDIAPEWAADCSAKKCIGMILETAHPAKFGDTVKKAIGREPSIPERLEKVLALPDRSVKMDADYTAFREWLLETL